MKQKYLKVLASFTQKTAVFVLLTSLALVVTGVVLATTIPSSGPDGKNPMGLWGSMIKVVNKVVKIDDKDTPMNKVSINQTAEEVSSDSHAVMEVKGNIIADNPLANEHVATKAYVDAASGGGGEGGSSATTAELISAEIISTSYSNNELTWLEAIAHCKNQMGVLPSGEEAVRFGKQGFTDDGLRTYWTRTYSSISKGEVFVLQTFGNLWPYSIAGTSSDKHYAYCVSTGSKSASSANIEIIPQPLDISTVKGYTKVSTLNKNVRIFSDYGKTCAEHEENGITDWRLPSVEELSYAISAYESSFMMNFQNIGTYPTRSFALSGSAILNEGISNIVFYNPEKNTPFMLDYNGSITSSVICVTATGASGGTGTSTGAVQLSNTTTACSPTTAGTMRYNSGSFEGCNGSSWIALSGTGSTTPAGPTPCTVSSWTPAASTVCSGESFTQYSNCLTSQVITGTKTCTGGGTTGGTTDFNKEILADSAHQAGRFVIDTDTVTDTFTGLIWQGSPNGNPQSIYSAESYCNNLNLAGQTDWRMPDMFELLSILEDTNTSVGLYGSTYWTNTTMPMFSGNTGNITINFSSKDIKLEEGAFTVARPVICVR